MVQEKSVSLSEERHLGNALFEIILLNIRHKAKPLTSPLGVRYQDTRSYSS